MQHRLDMRGTQLGNHFPCRPQLSQPCLPSQAVKDTKRKCLNGSSSQQAGDEM